MLRTKLSQAIFTAFTVGLTSISTYAVPVATMNDDPFKLAIPCLKPGFEFNIAALWLRPGASNLNYVILNNELPAQSPTWQEQELQPDFTAAFEIGLRYYLPHASANDVRLNWTHLDSNTSAHTTADGVDFFLGPDWEIGPDGIPVRDAFGSVNFKYDVVNLDVGQYISFGERLQMRFFAGLSAGWLKEDVKSTLTGDLFFPTGPFSMTQDVQSEFSGIGPRVGMSAEYATPWGIGFLGEAGMSALIGSISTRTNYTSSSPVLIFAFDQTSNSQFIKDERVYQVIPGFDAKLGINYHYLFNNKILFTVAAGYQAAVYVNAISQYVPGSVVEPFETGGIFVDTMSHTLSNYSVQGPFLNFALAFS